MKFFIISAIIFNWLNLHGQDSTNNELKRKIDTIYLLDQKYRELYRQYYNQELDTNEHSILGIQSNMFKADSLNYFELKSILIAYGFPGYDKVGEEYSNTFWNIVQHQDRNIEFQKEVLEKMKIEVDKKNASPMYYAYLLDRVKINSGEQQVYGTQMELNADSTSYQPKSLLDPGNVDNRRREVGLPPISEYVDTMNKRYFGTLKK
ncbi:MAG: DUF6624 domain-containing protein [Bacteroidota bacterium]